VGILDDLDTIKRWVTQIAEKREQSQKEKNLNAFMLGLYKLSQDDALVSESKLLDMGFSRMDVYEASRQASLQDWVRREATFGEGNQNQWMLTLDGRQYAEALLDEKL